LEGPTKDTKKVKRISNFKPGTCGQRGKKNAPYNPLPVPGDQGKKDSTYLQGIKLVQNRKRKKKKKVIVRWGGVAPQKSRASGYNNLGNENFF